MAKVNNTEAELLIQIKIRMGKPIGDKTIIQIKISRIRGFNIYKIKTLKQSYKESSAVKESRKRQHMRHHYQSMSSINGDKIFGILEPQGKDTYGIV